MGGGVFSRKISRSRRCSRCKCYTSHSPRQRHTAGSIKCHASIIPVLPPGFGGRAKTHRRPNQLGWNRFRPNSKEAQRVVSNIVGDMGLIKGQDRFVGLIAAPQGELAWRSDPVLLVDKFFEDHGTVRRGGVGHAARPFLHQWGQPFPPPSR